MSFFTAKQLRIISEERDKAKINVWVDMYRAEEFIHRMFYAAQLNNTEYIEEMTPTIAEHVFNMLNGKGFIAEYKEHTSEMTVSWSEADVDKPPTPPETRIFIGEPRQALYYLEARMREMNGM